MAAFPQLLTPLTDGTVTLRLAAERDIPEILIAYQDDPELHLRLGTPRPPSAAELGRRAERAESDRLSGRGISLTIVEPPEDICVGQIEVHRVDWENFRSELAIWVAPGRRGSGLARRALALAGAWLLLEVGFERLELLTQRDNEPLQRSAQGAGFQFEGVLRGYFRAFEGLPRRLVRGPGARVDMAVLSLVRRDLPG